MRQTHFDVSGDVDELPPVFFYDDLQLVHPRPREHDAPRAHVAKVLQRAELGSDVGRRARPADLDDQSHLKARVDAVAAAVSATYGFDKAKDFPRVVKVLGKFLSALERRREEEAELGL
jgi:hypothetical protein